MKGLFFDIDGTLVSFRTHRIPDSTVQALTEVKRRGHKVFIATGRPAVIISNLGQISHLIDGYVTTNGAHCFIGDEQICSYHIPREAAELVLHDAAANDYPCIVVSEQEMRVFNPKPIVAEVFNEELYIAALDINRPISALPKGRIMQLSPFLNEEQEKRLLERLPDCVSGRWHPAFTDITHRLANKGDGLLAVAAAAGITQADTIAFGDGGNDAPMLLAAGCGVAMGGAAPHVMQHADMVTDSVDNDGIRKALLEMGLI
ncbi:MAG: Cof-type HAD-IIB family hydrolase [Paludibacteraceae bacterium]|nr:Cof-type HAD-IIB family hydrolase [Paludibacteraceae bacterium]